MIELYFMLACGILGLNIGLTEQKELKPFVVSVLCIASMFWPIYLAVWAYHRYGSRVQP